MGYDRVMRSTVGVVLVAVLCGVATAGPAEDSDALFKEGRELEKQGKTAEACDKYKAALDLNRNAVGTILNVALCDEKAEKFASAYKLFKDAKDRAHEQSLSEHEKAADDHMRNLEDKIAHLALAFAEEPTEDTKIVIENETVPRDKSGDVGVDPGVVAIVVSRPGRVTYETKVTIGKAEHKAIAIPKLALPVTVRSGKTTFGKVLTFGGAGVALVGVGIGIEAWRIYGNWVPSHCPTIGGKPTCDEQGYNRSQHALTLGSVGTYVGVAGVAIAAAGAYLWFSGRHSEEKLAVVPQLAPDQAGIAAVGRF